MFLWFILLRLLIYFIFMMKLLCNEVWLYLPSISCSVKLALMGIFIHPRNQKIYKTRLPPTPASVEPVTNNQGTLPRLGNLKSLEEDRSSKLWTMVQGWVLGTWAWDQNGGWSGDWKLSIETTRRVMQNPTEESRGRHGACQSGHLNRDIGTIWSLIEGAEEGTGAKNIF